MQSFEVLNQMKTSAAWSNLLNKIGSLVVHKNDVQTKFFSLERVKNTECPQIPRSEKK